MNSYILFVAIAQLAFVAYLWRSRTRTVPFVLGGLTALGTWAVVLLMPIETHAVVLDMPRPSGDVAGSVRSSVPTVAAVVGGLLFIGINQLILLGVRALVDRVWPRG